MKRGAPLKRAPLQRRTPLRSRPKPRRVELGEAEWKAPRLGWCDVCGHFSLRLHHHHVLYEQVIRREHGDCWHPDNGMFLCCLCHMNHHSGARKIALSKVPARAVAFAVALLGEHRAADFFSRRYAVGDVPRRLAA